MTDQKQDPVNVTVDVHRDEVLVLMNRAVQWMALPPAAARAIGKALLDAADAIDPPAKG